MTAGPAAQRQVDAAVEPVRPVRAFSDHRRTATCRWHLCSTLSGWFALFGHRPRHGTSMAHPWHIRVRPGSSTVDCSTPLSSHYGPQPSEDNRLIRLRDAEAAGSNPATPTTKVLVSGMRGLEGERALARMAHSWHIPSVRRRPLLSAAGRAPTMSAAERSAALTAWWGRPSPTWPPLATTSSAPPSPRSAPPWTSAAPCSVPPCSGAPRHGPAARPPQRR